MTVLIPEEGEARGKSPERGKNGALNAKIARPSKESRAPERKKGTHPVPRMRPLFPALE